MAKDDEIFIILKKRPKQLRSDQDFHKRQESRSLRKHKAKRQRLRVSGKQRKKLKTEEDGYGIYTGTFFQLNPPRSTGRRNPYTLEIILLIDRVEVNSTKILCFSIEEWNGRSDTRKLTKRYFYKDDEGNWKPGKSMGFDYSDLKYVFKEDAEGKRFRKEIMKLLEGTSQED